jgi:primosomal protein N' (replication factor Y) (superfamily II helicase)
VVNADTSINLPDFRAGERTFQLLSRVAGRAGRGILGGRVIIQTYEPSHYAVAAAARHDYTAFYRQEMEYRRELNNPPFNRLMRLVYSNSSENRCIEEGKKMARALANERDAAGIPETTIIGPAPAFISRLRGRFRWTLVVRGPQPAALLKNITPARGWTVDIDPVGIV